MIIVTLSSGATTAGSPIQLTAIKNTNPSILGLSEDGTGIEIYKPGVYKIVGDAVLTSTAASNYGLDIYADDTLINIMYATSEESGERLTTPVVGVVEAKQSMDEGFVKIEFRAEATPTISNSYITVERVQ